MTRNKQKIWIAALIGTMVLSGCTSAKQPKETTAHSETETTASAIKETSASVVAETQSAASETSSDPSSEKTEGIRIIPATLENEYLYDEVKYDDGTFKIGINSNYFVLKLGSLRNGTTDSSFLSETEKKVMESVNKNMKEHADAIMKDYKDMAQENESIHKDDPDSDYGNHYYDDCNAKIRRCDSRILSLAITEESFSGGPHGYVDYYGINYDMQNGRELAIEDLVKDKEAFLSVVEKELLKDYPDIKDGLLGDNLSDMLREMYDHVDQQNMRFAFSMEGLELMFPQYDLTAYAAGPEFVFLKYKEHPELFHSEYFEVPKYYVETLDEGLSYTIDDSNAAEHSLSYDFIRGDDPELIDGIKVTLDGESFDVKDEYGFYDAKIYLFHSKYGNFLMIECKTDNDIHYKRMVDLQKRKILEQKEESGDDYAAPYDMIPLDPDHFSLSVRSDLASTTLIAKNFHLNEKGLPEAEDAYYSYVSPIKFTLKEAEKFIVFRNISEDGSKAKDTREFSEGTVFTLLRTDDKSWFDAQTEDGSYVHIPVDASDWPHLVNGKDVESVFDGVIFAG